jgi:hypothetical protein
VGRRSGQVQETFAAGRESASVVVKLALRYADVSFAGGLDYGLDGGHAPAGIALMAGKASGLLDAWASSRRLVYTAPQCLVRVVAFS